MNLNKSKKQLVLGVALVCATTVTSALNLGKSRGAVLLGQPLSLIIAIQAGDDETPEDQCFEAEVFYGDTRQDGGKVSLVQLRNNRGVVSELKLIGSAPIDEPVVTVYVRSNCGSKVSRKYVFLSDLARDFSPQSVIDDGVPKGQNLALPEALQTRIDSSNASAYPEAGSVAVSKSVQARSKSGLSSRPRASDLQTQSRTTIKSGFGRAERATLRLSMVDLIDIKDPALKISDVLASLPVEVQVKREAAIAIWKSLNNSPDGIALGDSQQVALQQDLSRLRDVTKSNQLELQELSNRLQQSKVEPQLNSWVMGLAGMLSITVLALVGLIWRLRFSGQRSSPWWRVEVSPRSAEDALDHEKISQIVPIERVAGQSPFAGANSTHVSVVPQPLKQDSAVQNGGASLDLDLDLDLGSPVSKSQENLQHTNRKEFVDQTVKAPASPTRDQPQSLFASLHAINTQEMLDVRQQADFFMTLGQHEEAIEVLEGSIRESDASNPLVYLDLLKVLHTLSRKTAFDHFRTEFNQIFTGRIQTYIEFGQPGNSLDAYPQICNEISDLWGTEAVVEFLEQCMIRRPEDSADLYFDLDAFRDLLLLHGVAGRISLKTSSDSGLMPFSAVKAGPFGQDVTPPTVAPAGFNVADSMPFVEPIAGDADGADSAETSHNLINFDVSELSAPSPISSNKLD